MGEEVGTMQCRVQWEQIKHEKISIKKNIYMRKEKNMSMYKNKIK
jgi:hypothetical protein